MAEDYPPGLSRLWYRSSGFKEGQIVTADFRDPHLKKYLGLNFVEAGDGLYYLDYQFRTLGIHIAIIYENGIKVTSQNFRIIRSGRSRGNLLNFR
jgi:hypothetical protein